MISTLIIAVIFAVRRQCTGIVSVSLLGLRFDERLLKCTQISPEPSQAALRLAVGGLAAGGHPGAAMRILVRAINTRRCWSIEVCRRSSMLLCELRRHATLSCLSSQQLNRL